jgi:hypothetical protein
VSITVSIIVSFCTTVEPGRVVIRVVPRKVTVVTDGGRVTVLP